MDPVNQISFSDFLKVDMRVGRIVTAEEFPRARKPAYKLTIDFGDLGQKRSSAQITDLYKAEDLIGRYIIAVVNFPRKQIADFMSEVLVLGASEEGSSEIVLLKPDRELKPGSKIS